MLSADTKIFFMDKSAGFFKKWHSKQCGKFESSYKMRFLARKGIKKGKNVLYFQEITGMITRKKEEE